MKNIILFGTGDIGRKLYDMFNYYGIAIKYWVDSDERKWNTKLEGRMIYPPERLWKEKDSYVCIAAMDMKKEMYAAALKYGVSEDRILTCYDSIIECLSYSYVWNEKNVDTEKPGIIVDCSNGLVLGGVEAWSISLVNELRKQGRNAYILSSYGKYDIEKKVEESILWTNIKTERRYCRENLEQMLEIMLLHLPCCLVINCSYINELLLAACCMKKKYPEKVRIIVVIHQGLPALYKECRGFDQYVEKYVAVSREIQKGMSDCGVKEKKILHMTCPVECVTPYDRKYSLDCTVPIRIGYAGRIEIYQKRMDALVVVFEELEKLHTNYHVQIAGTGSYMECLKEEIKKRGLEDKIELLGKIDRTQIADFWANQDVCINLSEFEGRSITIMEAMKNGAVPIVTATSGVKEDIENGFNGYIVKLGDYLELAEKISYLEKNRELISLYGNRAHIVIEQKSNMDIHMKFWHEVLCGKE